MSDHDVFATLAVFFIILTLTYLLSGRHKRHVNLPPGPRRFPVVGNLLQLAGRDFREVFREYTKQYGDIFTIKILNKIIIVVNGHGTLKDVFVRHGAMFSGRPDRTQTGSPDIIPGKGVIMSDGEIWKYNRRFILHTLRDFGMGKGILQEKINKEASYLLTEIEKHLGQSTDIKHIINMAVANIISSIVFGKRFGYDDPTFLEYLRRVDEIAKYNQFITPLWLRYMPGDPFGVSVFYNNVRHLRKFYVTKVNEHMESFDETNIRDVIDAYILEMKKQSHNEAPMVNEEELVRIVHDLFMAGSDTTTTVLRFALLFLLRHPDIQKKLADEVENCVPDDRMVEMRDRKTLPYTTATITEVLRLSNIVPFSLPHAVKEDFEYSGYTIPKTALIFPNLDSISLDGGMWDNPRSFNPSRFLKENQSTSKVEDFFPFSLGPRTCAGEALARMEIFLFLTAMVRTFEFLPPKGEDPPSAESIFGALAKPKPFDVRVVRRKK